MSTVLYLRVDKSKSASARITVQGSGRTAHCFKGNAMTVRVAVFDEAGAVADLSDHASLNLSYMPASRTSAAIATATDAIVNATFTEAQWEAGTHYHAEFAFDETDMNPSLSGNTSVNYWLVCYGILTGSGYEVTHGGGTLTVEEDGTENTVTPPDPPETGVTAAQVAAQIDAAALLIDGTNAGTAMQELLGLNFTDPTELTIAAGAITATQTCHLVDTEADAASDDLTTITAAKGIGDLLILVPADDARTIVLKHGTGNIATFDGTDVTLETDDDWAILLRIGTRWVVMSNGTGGGSFLANLVEDTTPQLGGTLDTNAKQVRYSKGADVASAATLTLGTDGNYFDITGTTAITAIATLAVGTHVKLHFDAALTLTHHATDLILPGGANITTAAGDEAEFVEYATGDWRCTSYVRASGLPIVNPTVTAIANVVEDTTPQLGGALDANGHQIREAKGADVASAASLSLGNDGNYFVITGTTTITSIATKAVGTRVTLRFAGALTLTHHATDLILPTGANITTAAGDAATFVEYATGDWVCVNYQRASGQALTAPASSSVPSAVTVKNATTFDVFQNDSTTLLEFDTSGGNVTGTIQPQSSETYLTGAHFWVRCTSASNTASLSRGSGVDLYNNSLTSGDITLTAGKTYLIWRQSSDKWVVLAAS